MKTTLATTCLVALALAAVPLAAQSAQRPLVTTTSGTVAGTGGQIEVFKGIPYAAPPTGALRWRPPQPPLPWAGVREATHFGDDCMQTPYVIPTGQQPSEDCLTVSVWTAAHTGAARRPVMAYFYGGGYIGGSCAYPLYDATRLAASGVVVVCFNYRVGIFGFLAHPMLSAESPQHASGNYGLMDQIAALKWLRSNVAAFGGDPQRITVFGESAGAGSIAYLMTSPLAQGLFRQAIIMSPALALLATLSAAEKSGATVGADLAALRRMSAPELLAHNGDFFPHTARNVMGGAFPAPIVDGYVLPAQPRAAFTSAAATAVPIIVGIAADEGRMFSPGQTVAGYQAWLRERFGARADALLALNPAATDVAATRAAAATLGDAVFGESARLIARSNSQREAKTFFYLFSHSVAGGALPATHSEILPFVFGSLEQPSFIKHPPPDATDLALSATLREAWTRFATTGDPNGTGLPNWARYDRATDPYLEFGTLVRPGQAYHRPQYDALEPFYADTGP